MIRSAFVLLAASFALPVRAETDVVIYGATSGGIAAAVQARRMAKSVTLIEPSRHIGGLTTGGLGWTDIGNKQCIGGIAREFYRRIKAKYELPGAWRQETKEEFFARRRGPNAMNEDAMWTFEPHVAAAVYTDLLREHGIEVITGERLELKGGKGVQKDGAKIRSITMESGKSYAGRFFIDATYEGDLMAKAGVSYHVGREANAVYGETLNGVQTQKAHSHQIPPGIDPYVVKGDRSSGLLPGIGKDGPGEEGGGDHRVQAYCFRMCLTDAEGNRIPLEKPADYDPQRYELVLRYAEGGKYHPPESKYDPLPNRKTDTNNHGGVSTDYIGMNYAYPEGDYAVRERIIAEHLSYQLGYLWTLQNDARVPEKLRAFYRRWGLPKDEYTGTGNWTPQLYIREARRMKGQTVMTQHHCQGREVVKDSVGMGAYNMDSHNVQRYVTAEGHARNEGDVQVGVPPYPVGFGAILPKRAECANLLVPVCLSASHIAFGSIRMEPVFMVLGQSAATAAVMALEQHIPLHDLPYAALRERLLKDGQVLELAGSAGAAGGIDPAKLGGTVVDDADAKKEGAWQTGASIRPFLGEGYVHDGAARDGKSALTFTAKVTPGDYEISLFCPANPNRATNAPVTVTSGGKSQQFTFNGQKGKYALGRMRLDGAVTVVISNKGTDGHLVVDGLQLLQVK